MGRETISFQKKQKKKWHPHHFINYHVSTMYIILVYDIGEKRVGKMLKLGLRYLNWIQNSVFEGEITEVKLKQLVHSARLIMEEETDSLILFKSREQNWLEKEIIGQDKNDLDTFI